MADNRKDSNKPCHIVIGAGTSGIMAAIKLLETSDVILIDINDKIDDQNSIFERPLDWYDTGISSSTSQIYKSDPIISLSNRIIVYQQGLGLGGTSNINAMILSAGNKKVFDNYWPSDWNSNRMNRLFDDVVRYLNPHRNDSNIHSLLTINPSIDISNLFDSNSYRSNYLSTLTTRPINTRVHTEIDRSVNRPMDRSVVKQSRFKLHDLLDRKFSNNLRILTNCQVSHVIIRDNKAVGVQVNRLDRQVDRLADRRIVRQIDRYIDRQSDSELTINLNHLDSEIIICAGVFESPRILSKSLYLCGLKPADQQADLLDHIQLPFICVGNWRRIAKLNRLSSINDNGVHGWIYLTEDGEVYNDKIHSEPPSIQLLFIDGRIAPSIIPNMLLPIFEIDPHDRRWLTRHYMTRVRPALFTAMKTMLTLGIVKYLCSFVFGFLVCNVQPHSKGKLSTSVNSSNDVDINISLNYCDDERDVKILINGVNKSRQLLSDFIDKDDSFMFVELFPGPFTWCIFRWLGVSINLYIRWFVYTYFHACGTCSMPKKYQRVDVDFNHAIEVDNNTDSNIESKVDSTADNKIDSKVDGTADSKMDCKYSNYQILNETDNYITSSSDATVDSELKVLGIENLRIADASVIPHLPSGPIAATCMAIGLAVGELVNNKSLNS